MPGLDMGRRYANAPIVEAIVEFHVTTPADLSLASLAAFSFGDSFTDDAVPTYRGSVQLTFEDGTYKEMESNADQTGFRYANAEQNRVIVVTPSSFAFIWQTTYTYWEEFIGEVEAAWLIYREATGLTEVRGIGVRFVNHISMPERAVEIKDYLRTTVDVPAYLPQTLSSLFMQVDIPLPAFNAPDADPARGYTVATVTSAMMPADLEYPGGAMLLDIDVKGPVPSVEPTDPAFNDIITTTLDRLRTAKNYVFEACITDATRDRIK